MPEGPEIRRAADSIERAIRGRPTTRVAFAFPHLKRFERRLSGREVERVETRGKAMLTHFEGGLSIYSHNQLYGRWYVKPAGTYPKTNRSLRLGIHNAEKSVLLYSASEIDVLETTQIDAHPFLAKLGPDVLDPELDEARLVAHIGDRRFARRQLHALLLDQGFIAGIGNYLRSEILFEAGLHPVRRPGELSRGERRRLARAVLRVARRSYRTGGITNDEKRARELKGSGMRRRDYRHHVFTRGGRECWRCGARIVAQRLASRSIFHCPSCQSSVASG